MSALPPKADMCGATRDVRFGPKADIHVTPFLHAPTEMRSHILKPKLREALGGLGRLFWRNSCAS